MVGKLVWLSLLIVTVIFNSNASGSPMNEYQYDDAYSDEYAYDDEQPVDDSADAAKERPPMVGDPVIVTQPSSEVVNLGTTIRLPCMLERKNEIMVIWKKSENDIIAMGDKIIDPEKNPRASLEVSDNGSILKIALAEIGDAGEYTCSVAIPDKQLSVKHTVSIRAPPAIVASSNTSIEAVKGMDVRLYCEGSGNPAPAIKWTRVGKGSLPGGQQELEAAELVISKVTRKNAGEYRCTASNGFGTGVSKNIDVKVLYSPEIEVEEVFIHTKEGNKVDLVCNVHAYPRPTVTWRKNGHKMALSTDRIVQEHAHNKFSLVISKVTREDFGSYSCHAKNDQGANQKSIEISGLAGQPEFKSSNVGREENSFLVEWSALSYSPVKEFQLQVRPDGGQWSPAINVKPHEDGPYHYAGKHYLNDLQAASRYEAKVKTLNSEGWNQPKVFYFATKGAEPRFEGITGTSDGSNFTGLASLVFAGLTLLFTFQSRAF